MKNPQDVPAEGKTKTTHTPEILVALKMAAHVLADYDEPAVLREILAAIAKAEGR